MDTTFNQIRQIKAVLNAAGVLLLVEQAHKVQNRAAAWIDGPEDCLDAGIELMGVLVPMLAALQSTLSQLVNEIAPDKRTELDVVFLQLWSAARELAGTYESIALSKEPAQCVSFAMSKDLLDRLQRAR